LSKILESDRLLRIIPWIILLTPGDLAILAISLLQRASTLSRATQIMFFDAQR
jgi:hypothetical protein